MKQKKKQKFVVVCRLPNIMGGYAYIRSDRGGVTYPDWETAFNAARDLLWGQNPIGYEFTVITAKDADDVWLAFDGDNSYTRFEVARRLARGIGFKLGLNKTLIDTPTDEEFCKMDNPDKWSSNCAWWFMMRMESKYASQWVEEQSQSC